MWLQSEGAVLEDEKRKLAPEEKEGVAAYCRRDIQLQSNLSNANRDVADASTVEAVLEALEIEHPEWTVFLQGLRGCFKGRETVADIQPDLIRLEVKLKRSFDSGPRAAAARAK
jgi:hypothetical protein